MTQNVNTYKRERTRGNVSDVYIMIT